MDVIMIFALVICFVSVIAALVVALTTRGNRLERLKPYGIIFSISVAVLFITGLLSSGDESPKTTELPQSVKLATSEPSASKSSTKRNEKPYNSYAGNLLITKIDTAKIIKQLPLGAHEQLKSSDGRKRQVWQINGGRHDVAGRFEIVGNKANDADSIEWMCSEFDGSGSLVPVASNDSFCFQFFVKVLKHVVEKPEVMASIMTAIATRSYPESAVLKLDEFSVETNTMFYFIRRKSRM